MTPEQLMEKVDRLLEESKTGLLATVDEHGCPHVRWMTPRTLRDRPKALFAVTTQWSAKAHQLDQNTHVEWMVQSKNIAEVVNLRGRINVIDNPSLLAEFMEHIGNYLTAFWNVNCEKEHCVVLETVLQEGTYFAPMQGKHETVKF